MPGKMARSDPRPSVRVTRGVGSGQHLASVLQEGWENANIDAGLGFHLENLGLNVFNAAKTLAQARGWKFDWRLVETARRGTQRAQDVLRSARFAGVVALNPWWNACDS